MSAKSPITTHVLDLAAGRPATGVNVVLEHLTAAGQWQPLATGVTNQDGRVTDLLPPGPLSLGRYRLSFASGDYFQRLSQKSFYPAVTIEFQVTAANEHYHVPLLLSPFGYSTYRGS